MWRKGVLSTLYSLHSPSNLPPLPTLALVSYPVTLVSLLLTPTCQWCVGTSISIGNRLYRCIRWEVDCCSQYVCPLSHHSHPITSPFLKY